MTNKNFIFLGAAALAGGLFTPVVSAPMIGSVNLFNNGSNEMALAIVLLAAIAAALAAKERLREAIWPGAAASVILLYVFLNLQYTLSTAREQMADALKDNPFASLAQAAVGSFQLQWGWVVLAVGAGMIVYGALKARKAEAEAEESAEAERDGLTKMLVAASMLLLVAAPAWDLYAKYSGTPAMPASAADSPPPVAGGSSNTMSASATTVRDEGPSNDELAYIKQHLRLYDLDAKYYESILDGRVPGVDFKIKNNGNRTLNEVQVKVVFYDNADKPIAEETYYPVLVSSYSYGNDNTPLRPNYIWQQEADKFYSAKNVPTEWKTGKVTATITDVEFGPAD